MTPIMIKKAIQIHQVANEKEEYYDSIARELDLDIDADVDDVLRENSPGSR